MDRLTTMPPEVLQLIISYLFESHSPAKVLYQGTSGSQKEKDAYHVTFGRTMLTCKHLNQEVNRWCRHFLATHDSRLRSSSSRFQNSVDKNPVLELVKWIRSHCVWCGKKSMRDAIMMNGMRTCSTCDRKHWPDKITLTDAKRDFGLDTQQLMTLYHGMYNCMHVVATMFLREDVEALAEHTFKGNAKKLARLKARREQRQEAVGAKGKPQAHDNATQTGQ